MTRPLVPLLLSWLCTLGAAPAAAEPPARTMGSAAASAPTGVATVPAAPAPAARVRELLAQDRWREALESARELAAARPADDEVRAALGEALFRAGELEQVAAAVEPLLARPSPPPRALVVLARLRDAEGRLEEADRLARRAVELASEDASILYAASEIVADRETSIELLERYLEHADGTDTDRAEAARDTIRVLRALGARRTWVPAGRPARLEIPLDHVWDPTSGRTRGYVLRARLGAARPTRLLLDTGSPGLYVLERIARRARFEALARKTSFGGGGDQRHPTTRGFLPEFGVGDLAFSDPLCTTTSHEIEPTGRYHGLVGLAPFGGYRVTLDLARRRLALDPPSSVDGGAPYWIVGGQILVRATLDDGRSGLFLLDTGASRTTIASDFLVGSERARLGEEADVRGFGGSFEGLRVLENVSVELQGRRTVDSLFATDLSLRSRLGGVEIAGFIGLDLLDGMRLVFDTTGRRVRLEPGEE